MSSEPNSMTTDDNKSIAYGAKLKAAREAIGLEKKDIAAQLRLGERIIDMLESGHYAADVPITFIRGYIRSYSKLLQIPESDVAIGLEPIKPTPAPQEAVINKQPVDLTSNNHYMQFSTYAIAATLTAMLGLWWYNHTPSQNPVVAQNETLTIPTVQKTLENKPLTDTIASASSAVETPAQSGTPANDAAMKAIKPLASTSSTARPAAKPAQADDDDDEDDEE